MEQNSKSLEQEIIMAVTDINLYQAMIIASEDILNLAKSAYEITKRRFLIGKADTNTLTLALSRKIEAMRNYL